MFLQLHNKMTIQAYEIAFRRFFFSNENANDFFFFSNENVSTGSGPARLPKRALIHNKSNMEKYTTNSLLEKQAP